MNKFWNWKNRKVRNDAEEETTERILELRGTIAEESWYADDVTPKMFKDELLSGSGDITVYINSPGGDSGTDIQYAVRISRQGHCQN